MGFNTLFAIKASDLPRIAEDEGFGEKLRICTMMSDTRGHLNPDDRPGGGIFLDNLAEVIGAPSDYNIQVGVPRHADDKTMHVIIDGVFETLDWNGKAPWEAYEVAANMLSRFGYRTSMKSEKFVVDAENARRDDHNAEWYRMGGYSEEAFGDALITFTLINDATDQIGKDKGLGDRIAKFAREWWDQTKNGRNLLRMQTEAKPVGHIRDSIHSGNHANPISIIAVTPAGETDVVVIGGNWGRTISTCASVDKALRSNMEANRQKVMDQLEQQDLNHIKDILLQSGFHVRLPGRTRSESPSYWNRDKYVRKPIVTPTEDPEV